MADGEFSGPISFELHTPLNETAIRSHIDHARSLGLPELFAAEPLTLTVLASGPSAINAPLDGTTLAVNGAISLFFNSGRVPTFWAACDPQALVADFLPDEPPMETIYLVASKCHPKVFEKLKGRDVRLWHVSDYVPKGVPSACSITLTMLNAFFMMGVKRFNIYGWDGCFSDTGSHHIGSQGEAEAGRVTLTCGDLQFQTIPAWANEAQDAEYLIPLYEFFGAEVNIHGPSMIKAIRDYRKAAA